MATQSRNSFAGIASMRAVLLALAGCLLALHFAHLGADLLTGSPWRGDHARFTDEGWYSDAAVRQQSTGSWYVAGDFNPAAALPVWPLLENAVFRLFGVSMGVARGVSVTLLALACGLTWVLLRRWRSSGEDLSPELAVLLLVASPFVYAFSRMAVLEMPVVLLILLALLAADAARPGRWWPPVTAGLFGATAILTKTNAALALPALLPVLLARWSGAPAVHGFRVEGWGRRGRRYGRAPLLIWLLCALVSGAAVLLVWGLWIRHAGLGRDVYMLFFLNGERVRHSELLPVAWQAVTDLGWLGACFGPLSLAAALASSRRLRTDPLNLALLLWAGGYLAFIVLHKTLQPRYYLNVAVPLLSLLAREAGGLLVVWRGGRRTAVALLVAAGICFEAVGTVRYATHPQWSFLEAAQSIRDIVNAEPERSHTVLGSSAADLALFNGLPHLNGLFATRKPDELAERYRPGWVCLWLTADGADAEPQLSEPLRAHFALREARRFRVMDSFRRQWLVLYRLDPLAHPTLP